MVLKINLKGNKGVSGRAKNGLAAVNFTETRNKYYKSKNKKKMRPDKLSKRSNKNKSIRTTRG